MNPSGLWVRKPQGGQQKSFEGWVYFKFSQRNQNLERFFICLRSSDLYCYENDTKKKVKFMHSLIGCFPVDLESNSLPSLKQNEL